MSEIQIRDRELEDGRKRNPQKVWDIGDSDPSIEGPYGDEHPDKGAENEKNIERCEKVVLQAELERRKCTVEYNVEYKGQGNHPRQLLRERFVEYVAECDSDDRIQHHPHGREEPRRRRPRRFYECRIPRVCIHRLIMP